MTSSLTYNIVGKPKVRRLADLAHWANMRVTVDSEEVASGISAQAKEDGHIDVSQCQHRFHVGDKLSIIPNHAETTINLHDYLVAARNDQVEFVWQIRGRGKVQ